MSVRFELAGSQIIGRRNSQEDAFLITYLSEKSDAGADAVLIVADGMGGHAAGHLASNLAVQTFNRHVTTHYAEGDIPALLHEGIAHANKVIGDTAKEMSALQGMGCTLVSVVLSGSHLYYVSVGDSHIYLLRNQKLKKANADHSYGGFLDRMAALGQPVEPEPGSTRNMLLSALTGEDIFEIDCPGEPLELLPGDKVILATDGLDTLAEDQIAALGAEASTANSLVEGLLKAADNAKAKHQDNTTVLAIHVLERTEPVKSALPPSIQTEALTLPAPPAVEEIPEVSAPQPRRARPVLVIAGIAAVLGLIAVLLFKYAQNLFPPEAAPPDPVSMDNPAADEGLAPGLATPEIDQPRAGSDRDTDTDPSAAEPSKSGATAPLAAPEVFRDALGGRGQGPEMVWIPEGSFPMGSTKTAAATDESPRHQVAVKRFAMSRHEVTYAEYAAFARATRRSFGNGSARTGDRTPVVLVTWNDAVAYTRWVARATGRPYRLPTEAEWEYAAAAGTQTPYWWGYQIEEGKAHCYGCGSDLTAQQPVPVGSFKANPFGLHDTAGNVLEWVQDCYHPSYTGAPSDGSAWEAPKCRMRVARGGAYSTPVKSLRSTKRFRLNAGGHYDDVGLRVVREP
ncbi:MAG: SUMF1/EgtB/PvdO family nonheme iron enzyme [Gammaproteobacteria bacterium]|nr:SUMF1/EgtB/PvdO family nonheme iron enzyme [Gammaproteobacteria bacterium]